MRTNASISGTSTSTPTTVTKAAPECRPNNPMATATANSKKLLAPIKPAGAAMLCGTFQTLAQPYAIKNIKTRSEEHTSELQSRPHLVCRLLLEKKKQI